VTARKRIEKELECWSKQKNRLTLYSILLRQRGSSVVSVGSWKHYGYSIGNNSTPNTQEEEVLTPSNIS